MYMKSLGFLHTLCLIGICKSHADELIDVSNTTCGETYNINYYESITLVHENKDGAKPNSRCEFAFVNNDVNMEICIRNLRKESTWFSVLYCGNIFSFYPGTLARQAYKGISCSAFRYKPFCTREPTVYALFRYAFYFGRTKLEVEIFLREAGVVTTTRRTTTVFWPSFDEDDHVDVEYESDASVDFVKAFFVTVVGCIIIAVCTLVYNRIGGNRGSGTQNEFYQQQTYRSEDQTHRSVNQTHRSANRTHQSVNQAHLSVNQMRLPGGLSHGSAQHTTDPQTYTDDAPSYSSVMRTRQLPWEEDGDQRINEQSPLAHQGELPENQPHVLPESCNADDELLADFTPEAPPPDYADLEAPPPPYPGY